MPPTPLRHRTFAARTALGLTLVAATVALGGCSWFCRFCLSDEPGQSRAEWGRSRGEAPRVTSVKGGTTVVSLDDAAGPRVAVQLWSPRGSAGESAELAGLAGLCAEAACRRHSLPPGISATSWATHDGAVCELEAPLALQDELTSHAARLVAAAERGEAAPRPTELCLNQEERWRQSRAVPGRILTELLFRSAFGDESPYGRPVLSAPDCSELTDDRLDSLCRSWFARDGLALIAVGGEDAGRDIAERLRHLPPAPRAANLPAAPPRAAPPPEGPTVRAVTSTAATPGPRSIRLAAGFRLPTLSAEEQAAAEVLLQNLARRARRRTATDGSDTVIDGYLFTGRGAGLLALTATTTPDSLLSVAKTLAALPLAASWARPGEAEIAGSRALALQRRSQARGGAGGTARLLGLGFVVGDDPERPQKSFNALVRVTARDLAELSRESLLPERMTLAVVVPEHIKGDRPTIPTVKGVDGHKRAHVEGLRVVLEQELEELTTALAAPDWEELDRETLRWRTPLGALLLLRRETKSPLLAVRASCPLTGADGATAQDGSSLAALPAVLHRLRGGEADEVTITASAEALTVAGTFLPEQLDRAVDSVLTTLLTPLPEEGAAARDTGHDGGPRTLGDGIVAEALVPGAPVATDEPDYARIAALHRRIARPENVVLTVTGPVAPELLGRMAATALFSMDGPAPPSRQSDSPVPDRSQRTIHRTIRGPSAAQLWLAFPTEGLAHEHRLALEVVAAQLEAPDGQPSLRLLRTGLATAIDVTLWQGSRRGYLALRVETVEENQGRVIAALRSLIEELRATAPTDYELDGARRRAAGRLSTRLAPPGGRAEALERAQLAGLEPPALLAAPAEVLTLDGAAIHEALRNLLDPERQLTVTVTSEPRPAAEGSRNGH